MTSAMMHNQRTQRFSVMVTLLFALSAVPVKHEIRPTLRNATSHCRQSTDDTLATVGSPPDCVLSRRRRPRKAKVSALTLSS